MKVEKTEDYKDAHVETLSDGSKRIYNKDAKGRIDNKRYLQDHRIDFLQPRHSDGSVNKEFLKVYGTKPKRS